MRRRPPRTSAPCSILSASPAQACMDVGRWRCYAGAGSVSRVMLGAPCLHLLGGIALGLALASAELLLAGMQPSAGRNDDRVAGSRKRAGWTHYLVNSSKGQAVIRQRIGYCQLRPSKRCARGGAANLHRFTRGPSGRDAFVSRRSQVVLADLPTLLRPLDLARSGAGSSAAPIGLIFVEPDIVTRLQEGWKRSRARCSRRRGCTATSGDALHANGPAAFAWHLGDDFTLARRATRSSSAIPGPIAHIDRNYLPLHPPEHVVARSHGTRAHDGARQCGDHTLPVVLDNSGHAPGHPILAGGKIPTFIQRTSGGRPRGLVPLRVADVSSCAHSRLVGTRYAVGTDSTRHRHGASLRAWRTLDAVYAGCVSGARAIT